MERVAGFLTYLPRDPLLQQDPAEGRQMSAVSQFTGTRRDDRRIFRCSECDSANFKIVKRGASEQPIIECANCEMDMTSLEVKDV